MTIIESSTRVPKARTTWVTGTAGTDFRANIVDGDLKSGHNRLCNSQYQSVANKLAPGHVDLHLGIDS